MTKKVMEKKANEGTSRINNLITFQVTEKYERFLWRWHCEHLQLNQGEGIGIAETSWPINSLDSSCRAAETHDSLDRAELPSYKLLELQVKSLVSLCLPVLLRKSKMLKS